MGEQVAARSKRKEQTMSDKYIETGFTSDIRRKKIFPLI